MRSHCTLAIELIRRVLLASCIVASLGLEVTRAEEPRETSRTEFGSEYSDGSSTITGDSATFTAASGYVRLTIDSGRPVERAVRTLQIRYPYVITYEDPQYTNEDDLEDVSASVVRNYSSYAPGTAPKVIVPKRSKLILLLPVALNLGPQDLGAILLQLVRAQAIGPRGAHFRVEAEGGMFHLIPIEVRDGNGNWAHYSSILDTPISLPETDRSEAELYTDIAAALSAATHPRRRVLMSAASGPGLRTRVGATQEQARAVLTRVLKLHNGRRTWALLHSPEEAGNDVFMLNLVDFPAEAQEASLASEILHIPGTDYFLVRLSRTRGGPATEAERADAITSAGRYCRAQGQRLLLLPLEKHHSPIIPAAVCNCVPDESLQRQSPDPAEGPAGTGTPKRR